MVRGGKAIGRRVRCRVLAAKRADGRRRQAHLAERVWYEPKGVSAYERRRRERHLRAAGGERTYTEIVTSRRLSGGRVACARVWRRGRLNDQPRCSRTRKKGPASRSSVSSQSGALSMTAQTSAGTQPAARSRGDTPIEGGTTRPITHEMIAIPKKIKIS